MTVPSSPASQRAADQSDACAFDLEGDKPREECGVVGIFGIEEASALSALGLHALQHRGQEAAGIVSFDGERFFAERHQGLVGDNFVEHEVIDKLKGGRAIGHVRYSTQGAPSLRNIQPLYADLFHGGMAIAHNGHLTNARTLQKRLIQEGAIYHSTSDTEVILHLIARSRGQRLIERFIDALRQIEGAYALVAMTGDMLIGARDPVGIRPLVLGLRGDGYVLASETCALDVMGATFVREVENGEIVVITKDGLASHKPFPPRPAQPCIFEFIYFSRSDSVIDGRSVYDVRKRMGAELAREAPADVDVVVPIPDSAIPAALGFANQSGLPFEFGIIRNNYVGRTFIEPAQQIRQLGVKLKHSANRAAIKDKRVVLIDDSVVRGTTSRKLVPLMLEAGAKEVHMRIACPEIKFTDHYGIDTPRTEELLASSRSLEEMRAYMGAASLHFLSVGGLYRAMGYGPRNPSAPQFTDHCFTGDYPTELTDKRYEDGGDGDVQLSLLAEAR